MTRHILFCTTLFQILFFSSAKSQATIQLLLLNDGNNQPLETTIKWHGQKSNKDYYFKTDKTGKTTVVIQGGDSYKTSVPYSLDEYTVDVPSDPNFKKDLVLKFEIEKATPPPVVAEQPKPQVRVKINYQNLVGLQILNKPQGKRLEIVEIESQKKIKTMERDTESFALPTEKHYKLVMEGVDIQGATMDMSVFSPKMVAFVLYFNSNKTARLYPVVNATAINIQQTNLASMPVVGDTIRLLGAKNNKEYASVTGQNGSVLFIVPKNDNYEVNLKYRAKFLTLDVEKSQHLDFMVYSYILKYPGCLEYETQVKELLKKIAENDSTYQFLWQARELESPQFNEQIYKEKDTISPKLAQNGQYFEQNNKVVCAVLHRFHHTWTDKVIVTDVTRGMYPYMKQLALWHSLESQKTEKNTFMFFNDGDEKLPFDKVIGKIGGIYVTQKNLTDSIIRVMLYAKSKGDGGEPPENNVEALIESQDFALPFSEIIMIADCYSPIKDLILLPKFKKPVHIILCGAKRFESIHPDYIWLAYKTRGSLHTIEEDIMDLSGMVEGKILTVNGRNYQFLNNRFFEVR